MIVYGYAYDLEKLPKKMREEARELDGMQTCYSVSRNHVYAAVLGVVLDSSSCLFSPVPLAGLTTVPTEAQKAELARLWGAVPAAIRAQADKPDPDVFVFEDTDD